MKDLHQEQAGKEEKDANSCNMDVTLAYPTVPNGSRRKEGHEDDGTSETHLYFGPMVNFCVQTEHWANIPQRR